MSVRPRPGRASPTLAARLERDPRVAAVEPEAATSRASCRTTRRCRSRPALGGEPYQWYLHRQGFPAAWDLSRGTGALVGVIDSGIDAAHPDLAGKIAVGPRPRRHDGRDRRRGRPRHPRRAASHAARPTTASGSRARGSTASSVLEKSDLTSSSVIASLVDAARSGAGVINMSFGGGRLSVGEQRALSYALRQRRGADRRGRGRADPRAGPSRQGPAADRHRAQARRRAGASSSRRPTSPAARASFAGRGSQISMAAFGDTGRRAGAGHLLDLPGERDPDRDGRLEPARRRRVPPAAPPSTATALRLPGRARRWRRRRSRAPWRSCARPTRSCARAAVVRMMKQTATRAPGERMDDRAGLGDPERRGRGAARARARTATPFRPAPAGAAAAAARGTAVHPAVAGPRPRAAGRRPAGHRVLRGLRPGAAARYKLLATTDAQQVPLPGPARQALLVLRARPGPGRQRGGPRRAGRTSVVRVRR